MKEKNTKLHKNYFSNTKGDPPPPRKPYSRMLIAKKTLDERKIRIEKNL